jgi:hypothetical protein
MTNIPWRLLPSSALALLFACTEAEEPPRLHELGDPCRVAYDACLDDDSVRSCVDGVWVERDCASVCADRGPAYAPAGCELECVCALVDPSGCTPGEATCMDEDTLAVCDELQDLQPTSCLQVCADAGLEPIGCREEEDQANCWCTSEGTPCEASSTPRCVDEGSIAVCDGETWVFSECEAVCGHPAACDPFRQPAACDC